MSLFVFELNSMDLWAALYQVLFLRIEFSGWLKLAEGLEKTYKVELI